MIDLFRDLGFVQADQNYRGRDEVDWRRVTRARRRKLAAFLWFPGLLAVIMVGVWVGAGTAVEFVLIGALLAVLILVAEGPLPRT